MTNSSESPFPFELVTWYDTWNENALKKLQEERGVPLHYATRYNLAFGQLVPQAGGAYSIEMGNFAAQVKALIHKKRPNAQIWASTGPDGGVEDAVMDNREHGNRSTTAIVTWLKDNGYHGLVIDEENNTSQVPEFVTQLGPSFKKANLGIIVSAMWPDLGPTGVFGDQAVKAFHQHVAAIELQDYSPSSAPGKGTEAHALQWIKAGIPAGDLLGGVCTERGKFQTSLADTGQWTTDAIRLGLRGMVSWRLSNDHASDIEDVEPTFVGAKTVYDTAHRPPT